MWLRVSMFGMDDYIRYPFSVHPADFSCHEVEVRRDGKPLPRIATLYTQAGGQIHGSFGGCGSLGLPAKSSHTGRIPLHLQYRFDRPGTYEVRYTMRNMFPPGDTPIARSAWTRIEILPGTRTDRVQWLKEQRAHASSGTVELLTDFLPGILGSPEPESLALLCGYLYHPDVLVRQYAMVGLTYWPEPEAQAAVREAMRTRGPSDASVAFFFRRPGSHDESTVEASLPSLRSDDPVLLRGAVIAVQRAVWVDSPLRARAENALIDSADHIAAIADAQTLNDCAAALGGFRDKRAAAVLRNWITQNVAREQAAIALSWLRLPEDLPKLAQLTLVPANGDASSLELSSLPYALRNSYGEAATPYLETMLQRSEFVRVRTASARELVLAGRPSGFAFIASAIERNQDRLEMIQFLRDQFPELAKVDDAAVLAFAKARAAK